MKTKEEKIVEFKKWCESNTATFGQSCDEDGYGEDYNIEWNDLAFYDELIKKVSELL